MNMWSLVKSWLNKNRNFSKQTLTTKQIRQKYSSWDAPPLKKKTVRTVSPNHNLFLIRD